MSERSETRIQKEVAGTIRILTMELIIFSQRPSPALSDDTTSSSQSVKDWTKEKEGTAQAAWDYMNQKKES
ncbi:hypothetical protein BTUL_0024g00890 [Botrytis tulipae]|uniref:Uncharacterized protein n=1 Tax=Botrytis tulipae TaxID=87230 RepID=A0A4Z1F6K0_9HELO|nr:hypothetical protein BTUL_0024g00890 [Botrytis tulipae]